MSAVNRLIGKHELVSRLLAAKEASGKTFTQISKEVGLTNVYTAQLFYNQAQLKASKVKVLKKAVPKLMDEDLAIMTRVPFRSYDDSISQEPLIYRLKEAVMHNGESINAICAEECGDGIMSAIDIFTDIQIIKGVGGERRVCIQLNGKFLPHTEQNSADNTAPKQA